MKKVLLIIFSLISLSSFSQTPDIIGGYFPYWRTTNSANFENYNYNYFAFVFPTTEGGIAKVTNRETAFNNFITATDGLNVKRLISVGSTGMSEMAMTQQSRENFADTLRKFCRHFDLQGIDMDWESISNATDSTNFTSLMKEIRKTVDTTDLEFVITVGANDYWLKWYSNSAMHQADFLQIMIYDYTGTWAASPYGNHASMTHFKNAGAYWQGRGFTKDQLVLGLPYYGYRFDDNTGGKADAATYASILNRFPNAQPTDNLLIDETGHYWFNGYSIIREKVRYAIDEGYKGVFVWEIAQDDLDHPLSLEKAIYDEIEGRTTPIVGIENRNQLGNSLTIYPNPTNSNCFIEGIKKEASFEVLNFSGFLVSQGVYSNNGIDLSTFAKGLYFVRAEGQTLKVIKD